MVAFSLTLVSGTADLGGNANFAANDALTAGAAGTYSKVNYSASRLQRLNDAWSLYANFAGQSANKNLDSSEKFALGGMGVRAYPQGEASGDAGSLLNLEVRYNLPGIAFANLQLVSIMPHRWSLLAHRPNYFPPRTISARPACRATYAF